MSRRIEEFHKRGCLVLGISTDDLATHTRWLTTPPSESGLGNLEFPLASDEQGTAAQAYGVYDERQHIASRGLFIIDPNGVLQYQVVHNLNVGRSTDELFRVLDALQSGGLCPAEKTAQDAIVLDQTIKPNHVLGNYQIQKELGRGAFGSVFLALDRALQRQVALKVLNTDNPEQLNALINEARTIAALQHQNICSVYTIDQSYGSGMIVMEYIEGQTLYEKIKENSNGLRESLAAKIIHQIADAMTVSHSAGVIHGDLKPANIMLTNNEDVKVMDFGLAKHEKRASAQDETMAMSRAAISTSNKGSGMVSGTPGYMAPELVQGKPSSEATDVFALGIVAYETLTGKNVIHGENWLDLVRCIDSVDGEALSQDVPEPFADLIQQTIVRDAHLRQISMLEIAQKMETLVH